MGTQISKMADKSGDDYYKGDRPRYRDDDRSRSRDDGYRRSYESPSERSDRDRQRDRDRSPRDDRDRRLSYDRDSGSNNRDRDRDRDRRSYGSDQQSNDYHRSERDSAITERPPWEIPEATKSADSAQKRSYDDYDRLKSYYDQQQSQLQQQRPPPSAPTVSVKPMFMNKMGGIKMNLGKQSESAPAAKPPTKKLSVAQAFGDDSSDEEEIPPEAKMRMRNVGRFTPTAAGPNSFGKSGLGFCDRRKIIEKELQAEMEKVAPKK